jgi:hypothetical protein
VAKLNDVADNIAKVILDNVCFLLQRFEPSF